MQRRAWSWFGTNMLGVGLHSYGFMDAAMLWLAGFAGSQLLLAGLATLPTRFWRSPAGGTAATCTTSRAVSGSRRRPDRRCAPSAA